MMTKYIIESAREASIYGFKTGDFSEADRLASVNLEAVREMIRDLLTGAVDLIRLEKAPADPSRPYNVRLLTRSVRRSGAVQMTSICVYPSGLEVPNYHKSVCMDQPRRGFQSIRDRSRPSRASRPGSYRPRGLPAPSGYGSAPGPSRGRPVHALEVVQRPAGRDAGPAGAVLEKVMHHI